jgi:hypothetical protein
MTWVITHGVNPGKLVRHHTAFFIAMQLFPQHTIVDVLWPYAQLIRFDKVCKTTHLNIRSG